MLFSELKCKDVINIRDCKKLGHVCDLEFDECSGCICKIMVPGGNQWLGFLRCEPTNVVICCALTGRLWQALSTPASILERSYASLLLSFLIMISGIVSIFS